jgi:hypothetical protein
MSTQARMRLAGWILLVVAGFSIWIKPEPLLSIVCSSSGATLFALLVLGVGKETTS